tara:strand:+ start:2982 stop:3587 length:606 start_codon:yes stop_codon:yes gene_type:complete
LSSVTILGYQFILEKVKHNNFSRRFILGAFAGSVITAAPTFTKAAGFLRGAGDIRSFSMISRRTGEKFKGVYCIDNEYIPEVLEEISYFMRDWRRNEVKSIDIRTIDLIAASHNLLNTDEPYTLLSGYRSAKTNAMLRRRSRSVARHSLHMTGQAADVRLSSRSVKQVFKAAAKCSGGGVGRYYRSGFVHIDCGPLRTWRG